MMREKHADAPTEDKDVPELRAIGIATSALSACLLCGCWAPIAIVPHKVPGWGETFAFADLDGSPADRGWFVVIREDQAIFQEPHVAELHVYAIRAGKVRLPSRVAWRVVWAKIGGGSMGASPLITTHAFVLADGVDPLASGPGQWYMGEKRGAIHQPARVACRFVASDGPPRYGRLRALLRSPPRAQFRVDGRAYEFVKKLIDFEIPPQTGPLPAAPLLLPITQHVTKLPLGAHARTQSARRARHIGR
jgi:hypothetical protein